MHCKKFQNIVQISKKKNLFLWISTPSLQWIVVLIKCRIFSQSLIVTLISIESQRSQQVLFQLIDRLCPQEVTLNKGSSTPDVNIWAFFPRRQISHIT